MKINFMNGNIAGMCVDANVDLNADSLINFMENVVELLKIAKEFDEKYPEVRQWATPKIKELVGRAIIKGGKE